MRALLIIYKSLLSISIMFLWIVGIIFAVGGWSTFFSIVFPPYAWYLVVEHFMILYGII